jgi:hypothetical protein
VAKTAKRLWGPVQIPSAGATAYTVPASTKTIVRHIHISNTTAAAVTLSMSIGAIGTAALRVFDTKNIPAGETYDWYGYIVVDATETIQHSAGTNNILTSVGFGDELTLG